MRTFVDSVKEADAATISPTISIMCDKKDVSYQCTNRTIECPLRMRQDTCQLHAQSNVCPALYQITVQRFHRCQGEED